VNISNKLVFYNKEGYQYNFTFENNKWNGKLLFDENSSELFKTIGLYIFEEVEPIDININCYLEQSQLFNYSGITFIPKTYSNEYVENILKSNDDINFYTKWVYGKDFDIKYQPGTIVSFSGDTNIFNGENWYDFINNTVTFYNVLSTKKDAILIETLTNNKDFYLTFKSGFTISSYNILEIPDYGNERLVNLSNLGYYNKKKVSIVNSKLNDGIYTYNNYSILKNLTKDYRLELETNGILKLNIELFTDKPKIYTGDVNIVINNSSVNGSEIKFYNNINYNINILLTGQTILFEDIYGNGVFPSNPIFKITGFKDKEFLLTDEIEFKIIDNRYFLYIKSIDNIDNIKTYDHIYIESVLSNGLNNLKIFDIMSISNIDNLYKKGIKIEVNQYVNEDIAFYTLYKKLKRSQIDTIIAQTSYPMSSYSGYSICYFTDNIINIEQEILPSGNTDYYYQNTIDAINIKYSKYLKDNGIELLHFRTTNRGDNNLYNYLIIDGIFDYNFNPFFKSSVFINNTELSFDSNFDYMSGTTCNTIGYCNSDVFYFNVEELIKYEKIKFNDFNLLNRNFYCEIEFNLQKDLLNFGFKILLNNVEYYIDFNVNTELTINEFIIKYNDIFYKIGLQLNRVNKKLIINGIYPNIEVIDLDVSVNIYSTYEIINQNFNKGVIISSDQIVLSGDTVQDLELSTGMIISLNNSEHNLNNKDYNILALKNDNIIQLSYQGPFFSEYYSNINIQTRNFLRKPRSYYNKEVYYKFSWKEKMDEIFYYDISGNQLKPYKNIKNFEYKGIKPLYSSNEKIFLNKEPNKKENCIYNPECQQVIFEDIQHKLESLDDSNCYNYIPEPMEIFIGFNSDIEGVYSNTLIMDIIDNCYISGVTDNNFNVLINGNIIEFKTNDYNFNLIKNGFEVGQIIDIKINDLSETGQTIYNNYNYQVIKDITSYKIITVNELPYFYTTGSTFKYNIEVKPKTILECNVYGQTEIEDERFDINLRNLGIDIYKDAEFIFKESDINEDSVDFKRLNRKRKEMLTMYTEIYNYIGSYKSLIHSIDFFGYNDLQLYEYYRNIKVNSPLYGKLHKVLISDIFDNSVDGWSSDDAIINYNNNGYYRKTNLFNLTYQITDKFGNYNLQYSLKDVQIKLMHLVKWLRKNIIPLSSNILDITGVVNNNNNITLRHDSSVWLTKYTINQDVVGVNYYYISTKINNDNYVFTIYFYIIKNEIEPEYFTVKIKTYSLSENNELLPQQNILLNKTDYESYSFNINSDKDPYISIDVTTYNDYGIGYSNSKMFKYDERRVYYLITSNFNNTDFDYLDSSYGYYIIDKGRLYLIKK